MTEETKTDFDPFIEGPTIKFSMGNYHMSDDGPGKPFGTLKFSNDTMIKLSILYKLAHILRDHINEIDGECCNFHISFSDFDI